MAKQDPDIWKKVLSGRDCTPFWGMYSTNISSSKGFAVYANFSIFSRYDYHLEIAFYKWKPGDPEYMGRKKVTSGMDDGEMWKLNPRFRIFVPYRHELDGSYDDVKNRKLLERLPKDTLLILMEYLNDLILTRYLRSTSMVC